MRTAPQYGTLTCIMKDVFLLVLCLVYTAARLFRSGVVETVFAESLLLKYQTMVFNHIN